MTRYGFLGGKDAINSLRSSGYKDTSMAIGELIDNSIQAEATEVKIVLITDFFSGQRTTRRIIGAAVIDNGHGMESDKLQASLVLGEGTNRSEKKGMGKFGVGLPQSSISQAKRVDAWSWTNKSNTKKHVYIDLNDDNWLNDAEIKTPDEIPVPNNYLKFIKDYPSGTIIEWSDVDRISWKKADTVFDKCENQIGRMYRYWLATGNVKITLITVDTKGSIKNENNFQAVDPMFLMANAKCGNPPGGSPMFKLFQESIKREYTLPIEGVDRKVYVNMTFSIAKEEVRISEDDQAAGSKDFGKIAKSCMGVSIVREGRELELSDQWYMSDPKDPRHRWWGAEISFTRDLDDVFGVTNNKQSATKLNEIAKKPFKEIINEFSSDNSEDSDVVMERLKKESPADYILVDVVTTVQDIISVMDKDIKSKTKKVKKEKATRFNKEGESVPQNKYDGLAGKRGSDPSTRSETDDLIDDCGGNRVPGIEGKMAGNKEYTPSDAEKIIDDVKKGHRCTIIVSPLDDTSAFFAISREDTHMVIKLNSNHPMYDPLFGIFVDILNEENTDVDDVKIKAKDAFDTIQFILAAWARMEDEERDPDKKKQIRKFRIKWGEILEDTDIETVE